MNQISDPVKVAETIQDQIQIGIGGRFEQVPGDPVDLFLLVRFFLFRGVEVPLAPLKTDHMHQLMRGDVEQQRRKPNE